MKKFLVTIIILKTCTNNENVPPPPKERGGGQKLFVYHGPTPPRILELQIYFLRTQGLDKLCRKKIIVKKVGRPYFGEFSGASVEKKIIK